jgi:hypothetical protein
LKTGGGLTKESEAVRVEFENTLGFSVFDGRLGSWRRGLNTSKRIRLPFRILVEKAFGEGIFVSNRSRSTLLGLSLDLLFEIVRKPGATIGSAATGRRTAPIPIAVAIRTRLVVRGSASPGSVIVCSLRAHEKSSDVPALHRPKMITLRIDNSGDE